MYLVFDVGGTFIKFGLLDNEGNVVEKNKIPTETKDGNVFLDSLQFVYDDYKKDHKIEGIALSVPGLVDVKNGTQIQGGAVTCLQGMHIVDELSKRCDNINVAVENDGKCAGLAEAWIGAAKDVQNSAILAFGTGVAGCIVLDKKVLHGNHLMAGEASFLISNPNFSNVSLDQFGMKYSTIGFLKRASKIAGKDINGEELYQMIREGHEELSAILNDWYYVIAAQCYNLQVTVDPDVICIGGGISAEPLFVEGIKKHVEIIAKNTFQMCVPRIVACKFRNDSNLIGALYNYKQIYESYE